MSMKSTDKQPTKRPRKMAREPQSQDAQQTSGSQATPTAAAVPDLSTPKSPTKTAIVLGLLARSEGATLEQMVAATGWLPHTTRAALTGLKKKGHTITSTKADGVRTYRVTAEQQSGAKSSDECDRKAEA